MPSFIIWVLSLLSFTYVTIRLGEDGALGFHHCLFVSINLLEKLCRSRVVVVAQRRSHSYVVDPEKLKKKTQEEVLSPELLDGAKRGPIMPSTVVYAGLSIGLLLFLVKIIVQGAY